MLGRMFEYIVSFAQRGLLVVVAVLAVTFSFPSASAQRRGRTPPAEATPAPAAGDAIARQHFQVGSNYYDAGDYDDALREFLRSYELSHRAQLFYNISLSYQQLGDLTNSISYLQRYLAEVTEVPNRANLELRLQNLRERDAEARARTARAQTGATPPTQTTATPPTQTTATASTATNGDGATATQPDMIPPEHVTQPPAQQQSGGGVSPVAIAGFAAAGVGVVGAAIFGILALSEDSSLSSGCGMTRTCTDAQTSSLKTYGLLFDVSVGVAIVGAVVGTVFLFVGGGESAPASSSAASLRLQPRAGATTLGLDLEGTF